MSKIKYNARVFIEENKQVMIRVRWNQKKNEIAFSVGCYADPDKWDKEKRKPKNNTIHVIGGHEYTACYINNRISKFTDCIDEAFAQAEINKEIPSKEWLKEYVNLRLGRVKQPCESAKEKTFRDLFDEFMVKGQRERNWDKKTRQKYNQMWSHLNSCDPKISLEKFDKEKMITLQEWYVENEYCNRSISKMFRILKSFLRWLNSNGYHVNEEALKYKMNLDVIKNPVTFLKFEELMKFAYFEFPAEKNYLAKARDMFCFMSFTSLRYSDLAALRPFNISDDEIQICTEKTDKVLCIPIIEQAQEIINKYKTYQGEKLFPVPSNQKLNEYLKEAAKLAGLDREVLKVYNVGTRRKMESKKFYEQISCHDARRTFVCCSLAFGIELPVVMKCTGHSTYETMKPYIEVADDTQKIQMSKWSTQSSKTEIYDMLNKMDRKTLEKFKRMGLKLLQKTA